MRYIKNYMKTITSIINLCIDALWFSASIILILIAGLLPPLPRIK